MSVLKIGDKVKCVSVGEYGYGSLIVGRVYTVTEIDGRHLMGLYVGVGDGFKYYAKHFRLAQEYENEQEVTNAENRSESAVY